MRGFIRLAVSTAIGTLLSVGAATGTPVDQFIGKPVVAVTFEIDGRVVEDPALADLVETQPGKPLGMDELRETIVHLYSLGRFRDLQVDATMGADGVALRFVLSSLRVIQRMEFRGDLSVPEALLRDTVSERHGPAPRAERMGDAATELEAAYRSWGFLQARVTPRLVPLADPSTALLVFDVTAGRRAVISAIEVRGTPFLPRERLLDRLSVGPGDAYDSREVQRRLSRYIDELKSKDYFEATGAQAVEPAEDGRVRLVLTIEAGPHVVVRFVGDPLSEDRRDELVPIAREGSVDEDLLEDSARRITEHLKAQGYWKASATYTREAADGGLLVTFHVSQGRQYRIERVVIEGNRAASVAALEPLVRLKSGMLFTEAIFDMDIAAITNHYRRSGYADATVQPAVNEREAAEQGASGLVELRLLVQEGALTRIGEIRLEGNSTVGTGELRALISATSGQPFFAPAIGGDRDAILALYLNRGYRAATVDVEPVFSADRTRADLLFRIREGPQILVDHILIVGNRRTATATIRRELTLAPGRPLGADDIVESQRRLSALGLFRRFRITELAHREDNQRDVLVTVEEAPATSVGYGGGLEAGQRLRRGSQGAPQAVERLEFAPRGFFEIGRRNLWGKNRSIDLFTRVSLRPRNDPDNRESSGFGFNEYRVVGTYREPRLFGSRADLFVNGFAEQSIRSSFNLSTRGIVGEFRRSIAPRASLSGRYIYSQNRLFDARFDPEDELLIDRVFPRIVLSTFSSSLFRDTRNDPFEPREGTLVELNGDLAARRIGSEVGFAKTLLQGFLYRRLPGSPRVVIATGARLGLAAGFPREVELPDLDPDGNVIIQTVRDMPASARFFAGGDTTVRGFALDRLGDRPTIDASGFPKGGQALLVFNAEVRLPVWRDIGAVAFLDAGNVYARVRDLDLGNIRGGAGFGLRYRSPIGPVRVDLGFKLDRRTFANGERESLTALHVSIGQAF